MCASLVAVLYQCPGVGVGPLVQQQFGDSVMTTMCCHVQCCQVVECNVINWRFMLQKMFDAFNMVSLRRHVERRQSILKSEGAVISFVRHKKRPLTLSGFLGQVERLQQTQEKSKTNCKCNT